MIYSEQHARNLSIILFSLHFGIFCIFMNIAPGQYKHLLYYLKAFVGIYFMYFIAKYVSCHSLPGYVQKLIDVVEKGSFTIYLFHLTFVYMSYSIYRNCGLQDAFLQTTIACVAGTVFPLIIHSMLCRSKLFPLLFSSPFYHH